MGQVTLSLPSDGTTIDASDVNTPFNTLVNEFNGNIDNNNIKTAAGIDGSKLLANSIPPTAGDANMRGGWNNGIITAMPTVTYNGNRSYTLVHSTTDLTGYLSPGMRLRTTRTVAAPTQCTSLNGTTQYYSRVSGSVNGMAFTNNFVVSAWVKMTAYGTTSAIASRFDGTNGWLFYINTSGQPTLRGTNAAAGNRRDISSYQSIPLNKWVHVAAQLDMSVTTNTPTTSYVMIDGVDVPSAFGTGGTNPVTLVQAGNLNIGADNSIDFFPGKIAQVAIYNAKVTQANILATISQGLAGTETSLISAYSFNNSINDLNANANNLTANGSAVATSPDSPFGGQASGLISSTLDYGIITSATFSTNTTLVVQVPEGCTIPTSGGVSAVSYSTQKAPYGFVCGENKWQVENLIKANNTTAGLSASVWSIITGHTLTIPIGRMRFGYRGFFQENGGGVASSFAHVTMAVPTPTSATYNQRGTTGTYDASAQFQGGQLAGEDTVELATATVYNLYGAYSQGTATVTVQSRGDLSDCVMYAIPDYL